MKGTRAARQSRWRPARQIPATPSRPSAVGRRTRSRRRRFAHRHGTHGFYFEFVAYHGHAFATRQRPTSHRSVQPLSDAQTVSLSLPMSSMFVHTPTVHVCVTVNGAQIPAPDVAAWCRVSGCHHCDPKRRPRRRLAPRTRQHAEALMRAIVLAGPRSERNRRYLPLVAIWSASDHQVPATSPAIAGHVICRWCPLRLPSVPARVPHGSGHAGQASAIRWSTLCFAAESDDVEGGHVQDPSGPALTTRTCVPRRSPRCRRPIGRSSTRCRRGPARRPHRWSWSDPSGDEPVLPINDCSAIGGPIGGPAPDGRHRAAAPSAPATVLRYEQAAEELEPCHARRGDLHRARG